MKSCTVPSKWDSPPASPSPKNPVHGKTSGRDIPLTNIKSHGASRQRVVASAPHSSVPGGLSRVRYRPPDKESFVFDVTTGYRFDPTTGLHYDANSGFFINHELEILLRWDPESNTYLRAGDFAGLGKPVAIPSAVRKVAATVLLGNTPSSNLKTTTVEGNKTRKALSEKVTDNPKKSKKKHAENAAESHGSKKKSKDEVLPNVRRHKRSCWCKPDQRIPRRIDKDLSRSKSNSPARQREVSGEVHVGRSRSRSPKRSKQSKARSRARRSVSRERNISRMSSREARRSRSAEPRRSHSRESERHGFRESRRSRSRGTGSSHNRGSQRRDFREHRRSRSRERRRSRGRVAKRSRSRPTRNRSRSRSTRSSRSRVTRRSVDRESDWSMSPSPSHLKIQPRSRSNSILSRNDRCDRMRHDISHSRGNKRKGDVQNQPDPSPKRKSLGLRVHSSSNSESEDRASVGIQQMKRRRSRTIITNSQDSPSTSLEYTNLDNKPVPESEAPEPRGKTHEETPDVIVIDTDDETRTPDEVYLDVLFDKVCPTNIIHVALVPLSNIPDMQLELSLMEIYLLMKLKEDDVKYNEIALHVDENVGAPYSYALITFAGAEAAEKWLKSHRKTFSKVTESNQRSKISLHFSEDDWECQGCHILNFSLRSLCHRCFKHKEQNRLGPISESLTHTRWVAVSKLPNWSKADEDIIADFRTLLKEFVFQRIEVVRDSKFQPLPLACVFEMHSKVESLRLKEHLTRVGRFSVFAVMHKELNVRTSDDPCDAPDLIIVEEPPPECIDLTAEDNVTEGYAEFAGASHVIKPVVGQQPPALMDVPSIMTPCDEQPSPLRVSYTVPFKHPADIISVGPVPYPGENAQKFYSQLFLIDGAKCKSVEFCREYDFGVSYSYCILYFKSPQSAIDWFNKRRGFMTIRCTTFPNIKIERFEPIDAHFHFLGGNWQCNCGIRNSPTRSICFRCYTQKGEAEAPLENSPTPTRYLGVKFLRWYSANELAYKFSTPSCTLLVKIRYVSDPMISRDDFGFYVFETSTLATAQYLRDYCKMATIVKSTGFVVLKDPTAGAITELDYTYTPVVPLRIVNSDRDFDLISGNVMEKPFILGKSWKMICPDYETFLWTSFYESHLNNPPTNVVIISLCPGDRDLPGEARVQIQRSLIKARVTCRSIGYSFKGAVGSPFSYCSIIFDSPNSAKMWFDKCRGTFKFTVPNPDDKKIILNFKTCFRHKSTSQSNTSYFIKSKLHYFLPNWLCSCGTSNFPLRSVCHNCFMNRRENSVYSSCTYPTAFVGIRLAKYFPNLDVSHFAGMRKLGPRVHDVHICLDRSLPRDPCGVIILSTINVKRAVKLHNFLTGLIKQRSTINPLVKELKAVLNESRGITYMVCKISLQSTWTAYQSENWDRFFNNLIPTNIIAIYHHLLTGTPPVLNIPIEPFGGTIQKFKRGGGFTATFWLVRFPSTEHAQGWYAANGGILRNQSNQLNLYFTQGIWTCAQCFSPNFPGRLLCHNCYAHKMHGYSPLRLSPSPTRWVGIDSPCHYKEAFASLQNVNFKFRSVRFITDPLVRLDGPSVLVFEVSTPAVGTELRNFFAKKGLPSAFFVVHESSESTIDIDP